MNRAAGAAGAVALAVLSYLQFPGQTWLQQDSQIYAAILEHQRDPAALANDIVVAHPHVAFTLYDEAAQFLYIATAQSFEHVLEFQQIAARALGIWGVYLMAGPLGAAVFALGAPAVGPAVFTLEFEPTPRAIALPLLLLAIGLATRRCYSCAAVAVGAAFLYHAPTTWPVLLVFVPLAILRREWKALAILGASVVALLVAGHGQTGQSFFGALTPLQEELQRLRASYVWISQWPSAYLWHWLLVFAIAMAAYWRVRRGFPREMQAFWLALPVIGMLAMPVSYLLLERARLAVIPQIQPLRALIFTLLAMQLLATIAAAWAFSKYRWVEGAVWALVAFLPPLERAFPADMILTRVLVALGLAALTAMLWRLSPKYASASAIAGMLAIPGIAGVVNYPKLRTPELAELSGWALRATPKNAVFLFPDIGRGLEPGVFRAEALRAVYVDWKGGGQVNYLGEFAPLWWSRWREAMQGFNEADLPKYKALGIRYIVLRHSTLARAPLFRNAQWSAYDLGI